MNRHLFSPNLPFPLIFTILIFITIHIPTTSCADDHRYTACSTSNKCGNINITYPFWGADRPYYCGHPGGFELDCRNEVLYINISTTRYRVLSIDSSRRTLTVVRQDYWKNYCPKYLVNTTIDFNMFSYGPTSQNLSLYYGCPSAVMGLLPISNQYSCTINATDIIGYYMTRNHSKIDSDIAKTCNNSVEVPVFGSAIETLNSTSANLLEAIHGGFGLQWDANINSLCDVCDILYGQCGNNVTSGVFTCYCRDGPHATSCGVPSIFMLIGKIIIGVLLGGTVMTCISVAICCRGILKLVFHIPSFFRKNDQDVKAFLRNYGSLAPKLYKYSNVKKLTNSFKDKLGQGGYGCVYKGKLSDGRLVAVKVLSDSKGNGEEFLNEVASISRTSHVNVVTLLGFCYERTKRALIYEFMPNGSLDRFINLRGSSNTSSHLEWRTLYQIAVGINARGLEYLHIGCNARILHFDIKPHNILLDEDFHPKISDFGLAKLCQRKDGVVSMLGARGTVGYIAPEVFSRHFGGVSHKSDVYSYGMMIIEMAGGTKKIEPRVTQSTSETYFPHWLYKQLEPGMELKLDRVVTEEEEELARKMIIVGLWCIQSRPSDRPSMSKVVEMLEGNIQSLEIPQEPFLSSPPRTPQHSSTISTLS